MIRHRLQRFAEGLDGTLGTLMGLATLEEEDRNNERGESRIPAGVYTCRPSRYHAGGYDTWEVTDVPGRSRILIHAGNTEENTAGCILVGLQHGTLEVVDEETGQRRRKSAVLRSRDGFRQFMDLLSNLDAWELEIADIGDYPSPRIELVDSRGIGS